MSKQRRYGFLPITVYWARQAVKARKAEEMSQEQLAERVDCDQATISLIEKIAEHGYRAGEKVRTSGAVERIAEELKIALPIIEVLDEFDHQWIAAGRAARDRNREMLDVVLAMLARPEVSK